MTPADLNAFLAAQRGGISLEEGQALRRFAEECVNGVIVEIGSFKGKSAVALACGQASGRFAEHGLVYCIEPHLPFVGLYGGRFGPDDRRDFYDVMLKTGCYARVGLVNLKSDEAGRAWTRPIGLLFVDGDHTLEGVRRDVAGWERHVLAGGMIVFDDAVDPGAGPLQVIRDLIGTGRFDVVERVGKIVALRKLASSAEGGAPGGRRFLVACHEITAAGGLYRFERFGRVIRRFGHDLAFVAFGDEPQLVRRSEFPVLTFAAAEAREWDATMVPGAGFPEQTIERFARLRAPRFGVRVQHVLNDQTRKPAFLQVNRAFAPDVVIFNNRHWKVGDFTDFQADAFHFLEGGVDVEVLAPDPGRAVAEPGQPFVVGGLATKNPDLLVEAVRHCGPGVSLHLFGPPGNLPERAADLVADGRLRLSGLLGETDLPGYYAGLDCVVHAEAFAGWANPAAEAMASGVPVICTPHGTAAFAEHEVSALVVEVPTVEAIAQAVTRLRGDPQLGMRLARAGRRRIERFGWTSYAAELLSLTGRPVHSHYTHAPEFGLFGKWGLADRLSGLDLLLDACAGRSVCDLGAGDGVIARRFLDRGAAVLHGFERDPTRVALARGVCKDHPQAGFRTADLSDWGAFETAGAGGLLPAYDIVLYLGLHHHLPAATRMAVLTGAAARSGDWLAIRTPSQVFETDDIGAAVEKLGFGLVQTGGDDKASGRGGSYLFRRRSGAAGR